MNILKTLIAVAALLPVVAIAQNPYHASANKRQAEQHRRIEQGIHNGSLTRREAKGVRLRGSTIRAQERRDRYFHHGHLTGRDRARLNREMNRTSKGIQGQKRDGQHRPRY